MDSHRGRKFGRFNAPLQRRNDEGMSGQVNGLAMFERTYENCDRYLNRIAQLFDASSGHERVALLAIASRLTRELEECKLQDELGQQLMKRSRSQQAAVSAALEGTDE